MLQSSEKWIEKVSVLWMRRSVKTADLSRKNILAKSTSVGSLAALGTSNFFAEPSHMRASRSTAQLSQLTKASSEKVAYYERDPVTPQMSQSLKIPSNKPISRSFSVALIGGTIENENENENEADVPAMISHHSHVSNSSSNHIIPQEESCHDLTLRGAIIILLQLINFFHEMKCYLGNEYSFCSTDGENISEMPQSPFQSFGDFQLLDKQTNINDSLETLDEDLSGDADKTDESPPFDKIQWVTLSLLPRDATELCHIFQIQSKSVFEGG